HGKALRGRPIRRGAIRGPVAAFSLCLLGLHQARPKPDGRSDHDQDGSAPRVSHGVPLLCSLKPTETCSRSARCLLKKRGWFRDPRRCLLRKWAWVRAGRRLPKRLPHMGSVPVPFSERSGGGCRPDGLSPYSEQAPGVAEAAMPDRPPFCYI